MKKLAIILLSVMLLVLNVNAVDAEVLVPDKKDTNSAAVVDGTEYYRQLYEDQKDYNDKILNTIYWALGGLATAIITVVGLNVFSSQRSNKAGLEAIKQEILINNEENINNSLSRIKDRFDNLREQNSQDIIQRIDGKTDIFTEKINILHTLLRDLDEKNLAKSKSFNSNLNNLVDELRKEVKEVKIDVFENTAGIYGLSGSKENEIRFICKAIEECIGIGRSPETLLNRLLKALSNIGSIYYFTNSELSALSKKIPPECDQLKIRLDQLISEIPIK
ncbi:hypothetical protein [Fontibacillus sp. BL9]|uniref:hypothetical protein n=1 Tax=Fontibacillus sp. BL9 TaxID=3389971 RepID=UPI00397B3427